MQSGAAEVLTRFVDGTNGSPTMPSAVVHAGVTSREVTNTAFTAGPVRSSWGEGLGGFWITSGRNGTNPEDRAAPGVQISLSSIQIDCGISAQSMTPIANLGVSSFRKRVKIFR